MYSTLIAVLTPINLQPYLIWLSSIYMSGTFYKAFCCSVKSIFGKLGYVALE